MERLNNAIPTNEKELSERVLKAGMEQQKWRMNTYFFFINLTKSWKFVRFVGENHDGGMKQGLVKWLTFETKGVDADNL